MTPVIHTTNLLCQRLEIGLREKGLYNGEMDIAQRLSRILKKQFHGGIQRRPVR